MNYRRFGNTDLIVSETGFGAWAIGGPATVGNIPIGWGNTDDHESVSALQKAFEQGINFYDTADFYGLGHSEELIGTVFRNNKQAIIATKVGQKQGSTNMIEIDYSKDYLLNACEASLKRLQRDCIDYYQLHVANINHLQQGDCILAMDTLQQQGKIRYWGISLSTYNPFPEARFLLDHHLGNGFQLVFNIINQQAIGLFKEMHENGYGIIARMPLQFGLLSGKFTPATHFDENDHRSFRLSAEVIETSNRLLSKISHIAEKYGISNALLALSFALSFPEITTAIPGIRNAEQAVLNAAPLIQLHEDEKQYITGLFESDFRPLLKMMQLQG